MNPRLSRGAAALFVLGYTFCPGAYVQACDQNSKAPALGATETFD